MNSIKITYIVYIVYMCCNMGKRKEHPKECPAMVWSYGTDGISEVD